MKRYAVMFEDQLTFGNNKEPREGTKFVEQYHNQENVTVERFEKKYGVRLWWRERTRDGVTWLGYFLTEGD